MIRRPPRSTLFPYTRSSDLEQQLLGEWLFGCDVCQDVCPWNVKFARPTRDDELGVRSDVAEPDLTALLEEDRKSTRLNSSHLVISYAVFCLKKKKKQVTACH